MNLKGGKQGLLVNSQDLCGSKQFANALFVGQNDLGIKLRPKLEVELQEGVEEESGSMMRARRCGLIFAVVLRSALGARRCRRGGGGAEGRYQGQVRRQPDTEGPAAKPPAPVRVSVGAEITALNESDPPQLQRISIAINKAGKFSPGALPACTVREIQPSTTQNALKACGSSLVGTGRFAAKVLLPQEASFPADGKLYAFNGRYKGRPAILTHVYGTEPVPTSFTLPFVLTTRKGELGTVLTASLAEATGRGGYITELSLDLGNPAGGQDSYLSAACPAPPGFGGANFPFAKATFDFGKEALESTLTRNCEARG